MARVQLRVEEKTWRVISELYVCYNYSETVSKSVARKRLVEM
jgi:hypothetical protein